MSNPEAPFKWERVIAENTPDFENSEFVGAMSGHGETEESFVDKEGPPKPSPDYSIVQSGDPTTV